MPARPDDDLPLYAPRRKIYPQSVHGTFRNIKWAVLVVTLGIYYLLPFVRWDRGPNAPSQAVLIDFPNRRFYFFFIEIWPQEVYYLTGLLILAAIGAVPDERRRRPHLVRLSLPADGVDRSVLRHRALRRRRPARAHAARCPQMDGRAPGRARASKHFLWLMVAWWTGGAWVLYFADAPTLVKDLATGQAPLIAYAWIGILTVTTYALAGHMREQVCLYMCPWPRIQAALTDEYALNVTYRYDRGEPRCSVKKAEQLRAQGQPAGDCVDCLQCVHVCPTGVDIRGGANLGCIQCGLCIDACDAVMTKLGRRDAADRLRHRPQHQAPASRASSLSTRSCACARCSMPRSSPWSAGSWSTRWRHATAKASASSTTAIRCIVRLSDGALRNGYTMRIVNKQLKHRDFIVERRRPAVDAGRLRRPAAARRRPSAHRGRSRPDPGSARCGDAITAPRRRRHRPRSCSS